MNSFDYSLPAQFHNEPSPYMLAYGAVCEKYFGERIDADTFYRDIFPPDTIECYHKDNIDMDGHKGNPLVLCQRGAWMYPDNKPDWAYGIDVEKPEGEYHTRHTKRILFNDYKWLHDWETLPNCQHVWMSGLTYIGKSRNLSHAVAMHAMIFDIDAVNPIGLDRLLYGSDDEIGFYPKPNYIVCSGNGVHLYYTFMEPIPL